MSRTGAAFSVRFLRNGDQITIVRNIIKASGEGTVLMQTVDPNSGAVAPDWTVAANQPIVQLSARSSASYPVEITGVLFAFDGTTLNFVFNGSSWVTATNDARFQARINAGKYELRVVGNIASSTVVSNKQISYSVSYVSNAKSDTYEGSVDVLIQQSGSDSHILQVATDRVELDAVNTDAHLTAVGMYGTEVVTIGSNGYTIDWYQDGTIIPDEHSSTLTVDRTMVEGGSIFIAKLKKDGNVVAQDSQRINDVADEYQIKSTPTDAGANFCDIGHNATYTLSLTRNGTPYGGSVSYSWQVYNSIGIAKGAGNGASVTVTPNDCMVGSGDGAYYSDADVQVTADF